MAKLTEVPNRTLTVLKHEAMAAREGTLRVSGVDIDMAELLEDAASEIEALRGRGAELEKAIQFAMDWIDSLPVRPSSGDKRSARNVLYEAKNGRVGVRT